jgi:hypothetical protein
MHLGNPVIRTHYKNGFVKQYVRDDRILRTEPATNNVLDYGVNKAVENWTDSISPSPKLSTTSLKASASKPHDAYSTRGNENENKKRKQSSRFVRHNGLN